MSSYYCIVFHGSIETGESEASSIETLRYIGQLVQFVQIPGHTRGIGTTTVAVASAQAATVQSAAAASLSSLNSVIYFIVFVYLQIELFPHTHINNSEFIT